jgi:hypothetical protein
MEWLYVSLGSKRIAMEPEKLRSEIDRLLRGLRSCDTQATAIEWMKRAFIAMEHCLEYIEPAPRLLFVPPAPKLEVAQSIPSKLEAKYLQARREELQIRSMNQTVVYPEVFLPKGLKSLPKPWTREHTRRLERAAMMGAPAIQKRGR